MSHVWFVDWLWLIGIVSSVSILFKGVGYFWLYFCNFQIVSFFQGMILFCF